VPGNAGTPSGWYTGGTKGVLFALDASTGSSMWQWDTTTDNLWGDSRANSGGGLWYPISVDENGHLFFGVGNPGPFPGTPGNPNSESRPGANLYTNCMISFDPLAGELRWYQQPKTRDLLDLDYQNTPVLATVEINGEERKVAIGSGKNGYIVCADRETGDVYWKTVVGKQQNADLEKFPEDEYIEVYPGFNGSVQAPIAYSNGKIFVPINNWPTWYNATGLDFTRIDESQSSGEFLCLDASTGEIVWHHVTPSLPLGSAAVANDVVITAGTDGIARAYATEDGTELWNFQTLSGVNAPVTIAGDMVFVGAGGPFMTKPGQFPNDEVPEPAAELIAFKLGVGGGTVPEERAASTPIADAESAASPQAAVVTPVAGADGVLTLTVEAYDLGFHQRNLALQADTDVAISFRNAGAIPHDFVVEGTNIDSGMHDAGAESILIVNLPAGEYMFFCSVPGHKEAGMAGNIIVE
jgi:outer membrane protein assembly factor BamB